MNTVLANITVSVTGLKRNFPGILKQADSSPVAVLNHNRPELICCLRPTTNG